MHTPVLLATAAASILLMAAASAAPEPPAAIDCCPVLELRQYTLKPGQRDALIALFDRHFVESQEAAGMTIVGQFRDRRRPDRFVWIRGFADMPTRHRALETFYGGPVWAEHKAAANATMVDVSDVRLLRPARSETSFHLDVTSRPSFEQERQARLVVAGIHQLDSPADAAVVARFEEKVVPQLKEGGVQVEAIFVTEPAPNTFAGLPVREGEHVLIWFGTLESVALVVGGSVDAQRIGASELLELEPTRRSLFGRHRGEMP